MYNNFLPQKELSSRARSLREFHQLLWRWPLAISLTNTRKKGQKKSLEMLDSPTFLLYYWYTSTPKLEILVTILLLGAKLGERAKSMKIKVKQARKKIRVWKKKHHVSGYWTDNVCLAMNQLSQNAVQANKHCIIKNIF